MTLSKLLVAALTVATMTNLHQLSAAKDHATSKVRTTTTNRSAYLFEPIIDQSHHGAEHGSVPIKITDIRNRASRVVEFQGGLNSRFMNTTNTLLELNSPLVNTTNTLLKKLHKACCDGNLALVQEVLQTVDDQYALISQSDEIDYTTLHQSVRGDARNLEVVRLLIDIACQAGVLQDFLAKKNFFNMTALELAQQRNGNPFDTTAIIELLESYEI